MYEENPRVKLGVEIVHLQNLFPRSTLLEVYHETINNVLTSMEECDLEKTLEGFSFMYDMEPTFIKRHENAFKHVENIHNLVAKAIVNIASEKCACVFKSE